LEQLDILDESDDEPELELTDKDEASSFDEYGAPNAVDPESIRREEMKFRLSNHCAGAGEIGSRKLWKS
jgi:hypothetical protein